MKWQNKKKKMIILNEEESRRVSFRHILKSQKHDNSENIGRENFVKLNKKKGNCSRMYSDKKTKVNK